MNTRIVIWARWSGPEPKSSTFVGSMCVEEVKASGQHHRWNSFDALYGQHCGQGRRPLADLHCRSSQGKIP
ncbi:hypothetical protein PM082_021390 [Marasmius tenuissimus]|nr:hypothetical protein PM082_021390 [Marasmius tenuissimus]